MRIIHPYPTQIPQPPKRRTTRDIDNSKNKMAENMSLGDVLRIAKQQATVKDELAQRAIRRLVGSFVKFIDDRKEQTKDKVRDIYSSRVVWEMKATVNDAPSNRKRKDYLVVEVGKMRISEEEQKVVAEWGDELEEKVSNRAQCEITLELCPDIERTNTENVNTGEREHRIYYHVQVNAAV